MKEYNFGHDSNGYEIDESTVEELARIANETINEHTTESGIFEDVCINNDSFKEGYYLTGTYSGACLHYHMRATISTDHFDMSEYINPDFTGTMYDYSLNSENAYATLEFYMNVDTEHIKVTDIEVDCFYLTSEGCSLYVESDVNNFFKKYDRDKLCKAIVSCLTEAVREVHYVVSNI